MILESTPHLIVKGCLDEELYNHFQKPSLLIDDEVQKIIMDKFPGDCKSENIRLSLYLQEIPLFIVADP